MKPSESAETCGKLIDQICSEVAKGEIPAVMCDLKMLRECNRRLTATLVDGERGVNTPSPAMSVCKVGFLRRRLVYALYDGKTIRITVVNPSTGEIVTDDNKEERL